MTFAVLGTIGAAIAEAAAVVGNVGGAVAASVLPEAIGGGAAGAGTVGTMAAATEAGAAGSALAGTSAAPEAATAALSNLAASQVAAPTAAAATDATAAGAAPTSMMMPNAAPGATTLGQMAEQAGLTSGGAPVSGAVPASSGSGATQAGITSVLPSTAPSGTSGLGSLGDFAVKQGAGQGISSGIQGIQSKIANDQMLQESKDLANMDIGQQMEDTRKAKQLSAEAYGGFGGFKPLGKAGGGELNLEDGQFIIPADVVSALGNGSTKAGAKFLDEFFGRA